jgi:hypothetical protein
MRTNRLRFAGTSPCGLRIVVKRDGFRQNRIDPQVSAVGAASVQQLAALMIRVVRDAVHHCIQKRKRRRVSCCCEGYPSINAKAKPVRGSGREGRRRRARSDRQQRDIGKRLPLGNRTAQCKRRGIVREKAAIPAPSELRIVIGRKIDGRRGGAQRGIIQCARRSGRTFEVIDNQRAPGFRQGIRRRPA